MDSNFRATTATSAVSYIMKTLVSVVWLSPSSFCEEPMTSRNRMRNKVSMNEMLGLEKRTKSPDKRRFQRRLGWKGWSISTSGFPGSGSDCGLGSLNFLWISKDFGAHLKYINETKSLNKRASVFCTKRADLTENCFSRIRKWWAIRLPFSFCWKSVTHRLH